MKAWLVKERDELYSDVVFAETRGKARSLALSTDCCEYANFIDIEVRRIPQLDKYYSEGKWHFDWYKPEDRIALVKEGGFYCDEDAFSLEECAVCPAKQYCSKYTETNEE